MILSTEAVVALLRIQPSVILSMRELDRNASGRGKPQLMVDGGIRAHKKVIKTF